MRALWRGGSAALLSTTLLLAACAAPASAGALAATIDTGRIVHIELSEFAFASAARPAGG